MPDIVVVTETRVDVVMVTGSGTTDTIQVIGDKQIEVLTVGIQGPQGPGSVLSPATTTTLGGVIVGDNLSINANGLLSAQAGGVTAFNGRAGNVSLTANDVSNVANYVPKTPNVTYGTFTAIGQLFDGELSSVTTNSGTVNRTLYSGYSQPPYSGVKVFGGSANTSTSNTTAAMSATGQSLSLSGTSVVGPVSKDSGMSFSGSGVQFSYFEDNPDGFKNVEYLLSDNGVRITTTNNNYTSLSFTDTIFEVTSKQSYISTIEPLLITQYSIMNRAMCDDRYARLVVSGAR